MDMNRIVGAIIADKTAKPAITEQEKLDDPRGFPDVSAARLMGLNDNDLAELWRHTAERDSHQEKAAPLDKVGGWVIGEYATKTQVIHRIVRQGRWVRNDNLRRMYLGKAGGNPSKPPAPSGMDQSEEYSPERE